MKEPSTEMPSTETTLRRFRVWCVTESAYVSVWSLSDSAPAKCPNDSAHEVDTAQAVVVESVSKNQTSISNLPLTPYDRVLCSNESVVIDVKPCVGITRLRDRTVTAGNGTVTTAPNSACYTLAVTDAGDVAELRTLERGPYVSGLCSETGIGGRLDAFPKGDQVVMFGAYDCALGDGFLFEISAAGLSVLALNDGVEIMRTHMADFNVDCMDGSGPSRLTLDPTRGYVWTIRYTSYGYGQVEFSVAAENIDLEQHLVPLHRYYSLARPSTSCVYLPVCARVESRSTQASPLSISVTGRKHSVLGDYEPDTRDTCVCRDMAMGDLVVAGGGGGSTFATVFAVRRRAGPPVVPVRSSKLEICIGGSMPPLMVELITALPSATASNGENVWSGVPDICNSETVLEYTQTDVVDAATPGSVIVLWRGFVQAIPRIADVDAAVAEGEVMAVRVRVPDRADGVTSPSPDANTVLAVSLRLKECW